MIDVGLAISPALRRLAGISNARARAVLADALNEAAIASEALVVESTPVETGDLRRSIGVDLATPEHLEAAVVARSHHAVFVEYGTGIYNERPGAPRQPFKVMARGKALAFTVGGQAIIRRSVTIQGMTPRPMFRSNAPAMREHLRAALRRHAERLMPP